MIDQDRQMGRTELMIKTAIKAFEKRDRPIILIFANVKQVHNTLKDYGINNYKIYTDIIRGLDSSKPADFYYINIAMSLRDLIDKLDYYKVTYPGCLFIDHFVFDVFK